jgi:hypothetical protein
MVLAQMAGTQAAFCGAGSVDAGDRRVEEMSNIEKIEGEEVPLTCGSYMIRSTSHLNRHAM